MEVICPNCSTVAEVAVPTEPTPGGVVIVQCPSCAKAYEVENQHGDSTWTFSQDTWLIPKYEKREGALRRGAEGRVVQNALVGYEIAEPGEEGARLFPAGSGVQVALLPKPPVAELEGESNEA